MNNYITNDTVFIYTVSGEYPLTFDKVKKLFLSESATKENVTLEELKNVGIQIVYPVVKPKGDVVHEMYPVLRLDGTYTQSFSARAFTSEEIAQTFSLKKQELLTQVSVLKEKSLEAGAPIDFGGNYGIQHVQMRSGDRANILGLRVKAEKLIAENSNEMMAIRTFENNVVPVTADQMLQISWKILGAYEEVMGTAWHYEDLIKASETIGDLPTLPGALTPSEQSVVVTLPEPAPEA